MAIDQKRGTELFRNYAEDLTSLIQSQDWIDVEQLARLMATAWQQRNCVFLCGNGGSAGNAIHLANDLLYGVAKDTGIGIKVEALSSNPSVLTCLANDIGYEDIFSQQLLVKAEQDDILIVLSGSGNSENVVRALKVASSKGLHTVAIVGYSGGRCADLAELVIHFPIHDMQIAEDLQLVVGHMCMRWLSGNSSGKN